MISETNTYVTSIATNINGPLFVLGNALARLLFRYMRNRVFDRLFFDCNNDMADGCETQISCA
jgi:hypothetical protein